MKEKIHYVIEAVLIIAVIVLFVFQFSGNKKSSNDGSNSTDSKASSESVMPVAYIDIDSLMQSYTYSIDLNEQLAKKLENSNANYTEKVRKLQADAAEFQRKYETNSFLSQERAQAEHDLIMKKQEELRTLEANLAQEFEEERFRMSEELRLTIIAQLLEYNKSKGYQIIYGKRNDNILFAAESFNITAEVIEFLNKQYTASPATK